RGENIDVVNYTNNIQLMIQRALNPAKVGSVILDEENKKAEVHLKPSEISLAIGKGGLNIRLASMLTGYDIDVYREGLEQEEQDDVDLMEFSDEIESWILEQFKSVGLDTARAVLAIDQVELARRTDLEAETIAEVCTILSSEFE
ncbi:MAG: transcription termination/antitermination protein NusA, partial [Mucinivorans sp.]